jgi:hypothetical protein
MPIPVGQPFAIRLTVPPGPIVPQGRKVFKPSYATDGQLFQQTLQYCIGWIE